MMKTYSAIQVKNPTSDQHVVRVLPNQTVHLILDTSMFQNAHIEIDGLIELDTVVKSNGRIVYHLTHPKSVHKWSDYSNSQLGEVWVFSENIISKLQIILETNNSVKKNHITVVNPSYCDFRIKPHHIFEVVVYDTNFVGGNDEWEWEFAPNFDINIDSMGSSSLSHYMWNHYYGYLDEDDPDYRYSSCLRVETPDNAPSFKQHHFWFRLDKSALAQLNRGTTLIGKLKLTGVPCRWTKSLDKSKKTRYSVSLYVDLNEKYRNQFLHTLTLERKNEYSASNFRNTQTVNDSGDEQTPKRLPMVYKYKYKKWESPKPLRREVEVSALDTNSLSYGCKVLPMNSEDDSYGHDLNSIRYDEKWWHILEND